MKMKKMDFDNSNKIDPENGFENKENSNLSAKQKKVISWQIIQVK